MDTKAPKFCTLHGRGHQRIWYKIVEEDDKDLTLLLLEDLETKLKVPKFAQDSHRLVQATYLTTPNAENPLFLQGPAEKVSIEKALAYLEERQRQWDLVGEKIDRIRTHFRSEHARLLEDLNTVHA